MRTVQHGDHVTVHYIGTLDNGRIFDSATAEEPLTFTIGGNQVFLALEREVLGMRLKETKNFVIPAAQAYGSRLEANILRLERSLFPADKELKIGNRLQLEFRGGVQRNMVVTDVTASTVTLDANHPLAGLDLTFALTVAAIG